MRIWLRYHFSVQKAAKIAVQTLKEYMMKVLERWMKSGWRA